MANYVSLSVGFSRHPKVKRFRALCGLERSEIFLIRLWEWAAEYAVDGDLSGYQPTEIESELGWASTSGTLFSLLVTSGFLDRSDDGSRVTIHNWLLPGRSGYGIAQLAKQREGFRERKAKYRRSLNSGHGDVPVPLSKGEGKGEGKSTDQIREQSNQPAEPCLIEYPCTDGLWDLTESFVGTLKQAYPQIDIMAEARIALAWVWANPAKRKTMKGMPRFMNSWCSRATEAAKAKPVLKSVPAPMFKRPLSVYEQLVAEAEAKRKARGDQ
ncbi:MAG TPA: hypothetical protein VFM05_02235 [Candidatus Saccharimonadales bacterium]|nr:hypothetical protein [Candidatus Saccharimonadales bacterium]